MAAFKPGFSFIFFAIVVSGMDQTPFLFSRKQMPSFHSALAFDGDLADIFALKLVLDELVHLASDLDLAAFAMAFHAAGRVNHVTPQRVEIFFAADHSGDQRTRI